VEKIRIKISLSLKLQAIPGSRSYSGLVSTWAGSACIHKLTQLPTYGNSASKPGHFQCKETHFILVQKLILSKTNKLNNNLSWYLLTSLNPRHSKNRRVAPGIHGLCMCKQFHLLHAWLQMQHKDSEPHQTLSQLKKAMC